MSGRNSVWTGQGFEFRDGRTCAAFKVAARSREEAARLINRVAGWRWFKAEEELGAGVPSEEADAGVWICSVDGMWEKAAESTRGRGRLPDAEPTGATKRVQLSMQRLREAGGHRSTVRFRGDAWEDLQLLMAATGRKQCDVLEDLIKKGAAELRQRKK
jgi:hypothetical protein